MDLHHIAVTELIEHQREPTVNSSRLIKLLLMSTVRDFIVLRDQNRLINQGPFIVDHEDGFHLTRIRWNREISQVVVRLVRPPSIGQLLKRDKSRQDGGTSDPVDLVRLEEQQIRLDAVGTSVGE